MKLNRNASQKQKQMPRSQYSVITESVENVKYKMKKLAKL